MWPKKAINCLKFDELESSEGSEGKVLVDLLESVEGCQVMMFDSASWSLSLFEIGVEELNEYCTSFFEYRPTDTIHSDASF